MVKKYIQKYSSLEKILLTAGLLLLALTVVATVFGTWNNRRFISDPLSAVYYVRYLLILGGGFGIGYLVARFSKAKKRQPSLLFSGVAYSLLAFVVYYLQDILRVLARVAFGTLAYPWERILFSGGPIIALAIVFVVALIMSRKATIEGKLSGCFKWTFVVSFIAQQIFVAAWSYGNSMHAEFSYDFLWIVLLGLLTTPLVIAAIVYALLGNIKSVLTRAFYSSVIGAIYAAATPVIWEFRTNAESHATMVFGIVATITTLAAIVILTWLARRTVR